MNPNEGSIGITLIIAAIVVGIGLFLMVQLGEAALFLLCTPGAGILMALIPGAMSLFVGWFFIYRFLSLWWEE